jgi:hypothetical protein
MTTTAPTTMRAGLWASLLRSPVLWVAAVLTLIASPALFLSTLVLGVVLVGIGVFQWLGPGRIWPLALGVGMVLGSLPYSITALVHLLST